MTVDSGALCKPRSFLRRAKAFAVWPVAIDGINASIEPVHTREWARDSERKAVNSAFEKEDSNRQELISTNRA